MIEIINKPWGSEEKWAHTAHYVGKILRINPDAELSTQYHREKVETMLVINGSGVMCFYSMDEDGDTTLTSMKDLHKGDTVHIPPKQIHKLMAGDRGMEVVEVSTNHLNDLVRLSDKYNRN